jgi:hypothetical protein
MAADSSGQMRNGGLASVISIGLCGVAAETYRCWRFSWLAARLSGYGSAHLLASWQWRGWPYWKTAYHAARKCSAYWLAQCNGGNICHQWPEIGCGGVSGL